MSIYLKKLSPEDGEELYEMLQDIGENENGFHNKAKGMTFSAFKEWLEKECAYDRGALEEWMVPQSSFWLFDDHRPVGYGRLRHCLNAFLKEHSGHIGYAVRQSARGKGYGTVLLVLLLEECKRLNIGEVQVGANADNAPSNKIIIKNGGRLVRVSAGKNFYKIDLNGIKPPQAPPSVKDLWGYLGKTVGIIIDRPLGSAHPRYPGLIYPLNYGYIPKTLSGDGEEIDVYLLGVTEPVLNYTAKVIAVIHRENDVEDKLVCAPEGIAFSREQIEEAVAFQERFFQSKVILEE